MSDLPYPTRLVWDGRRGLAKHDDVVVVLRDAPNALPAVAEIDYTPGVIAQIRRQPFDKMDDLQPQEREILMAWLVDMAKGVRRFLRLPKRKVLP